MYLPTQAPGVNRANRAAAAAAAGVNPASFLDILKKVGVGALSGAVNSLSS
jgi:hypothetical protein